MVGGLVRFSLYERRFQLGIPMRYAVSTIISALLSVASFGAAPASAPATWAAGSPPPDITVAADGTGNFKTVQAAVQSIPRNNTQRMTILVKKGVYQERVNVTAPFVTLVGEGRKETRIEFNPGNEVSPVVAVGGSDFILRSITLVNTGGDPGPHAVTISSSTADRVVFLDSDVLSTGADTVSLWRNDGRYYHARCNFRGSVDSVCPHGWCYAVDCTFFETRKDAVIWQDGHTNKDQKFVLRRCTFEGVEGFNLGRHHHDAEFFLLDCSFPRSMIDQQIFRVIYPLNGGTPTAADIQNNLQHDPTNIWGERNYYFNCHRAGPNGEKGGGDFAFFKDNLAAFSPTLKAEQITAAWTFANCPSPWDPESTVGPQIKSIAAQGAQIAVTFSESVTVKGKPVLRLADHTTGTYASGSGLAVLLFDATNPAAAVQSLELADGFIFATQASAALRNADLKIPK
jgi:pectinesterase